MSVGGTSEYQIFGKRKYLQTKRDCQICQVYWLSSGNLDSRYVLGFEDSEIIKWSFVAPNSKIRDCFTKFTLKPEEDSLLVLGGFKYFPEFQALPTKDGYALN